MNPLHTTTRPKICVYQREKFQSFTLVPGVEILWKRIVSAEFREDHPKTVKIVRFHKIWIPGNKVKFQYFMKSISLLDRIFFELVSFYDKTFWKIFLTFSLARNTERFFETTSSRIHFQDFVNKFRPFWHCVSHKCAYTHTHTHRGRPNLDFNEMFSSKNLIICLLKKYLTIVLCITFNTFTRRKSKNTISKIEIETAIFNNM